jgi:hypothetical protein
MRLVGGPPFFSHAAILVRRIRISEDMRPAPVSLTMRSRCQHPNVSTPRLESSLQDLERWREHEVTSDLAKSLSMLLNLSPTQF